MSRNQKLKTIEKQLDAIQKIKLALIPFTIIPFKYQQNFKELFDTLDIAEDQLSEIGYYYEKFYENTGR
jgi:hypothetical protein